MIKKLIVLGLFSFFTSQGLQAKTFTYGQVKSMPLSVEKDYYIWRFLMQKSTTASQAKAIIKDAKYLNKKLKTEYKKKTGLKASIPKRKPAPYQSNKYRLESKVKCHVAFQYGIKMVERNQLAKAAQYFNAAYKQYSDRWEKDKCLFWLYQVTKKKSYLNKLTRSYHINMYTLLAADLTKGKYPRSIVTPSISKSTVYGIDETNPIHWAKIKGKNESPLNRFRRPCRHL